MFKNILTATDLLDASDGAVTCAIRLCRRHEARLLAVHVLESSYSGIFRQFVRDFQTGEERVASPDYRQAAKKALAGKWTPVLAPYRNYELEIAAGVPWIEILRIARRDRADLIVLGAHGKGAEEKGVARQTGTVGSTVEGVVMGAFCPVLVVNRPPPEERLLFRKIMVGVDFSRSCGRAVKFAGNLAEAYRSELLLFHLLPVTPPARVSLTTCGEDVRLERERLHAYGREILGGRDFRCEVWEGSLPWSDILDFASENRVDLIVMGSRTRTSRERGYVGSTVQEVTARAECLTAVVTHPQALWHTESLGDPREDRERRAHGTT